MITATNVYSNNDAVSLARKINRLRDLGVGFDLRIVKGIGGENVVSLSWSETEMEEALYKEECGA